MGLQAGIEPGTLSLLSLPGMFSGVPMWLFVSSQTKSGVMCIAVKCSVVGPVVTSHADEPGQGQGALEPSLGEPGVRVNLREPGPLPAQQWPCRPILPAHLSRPVSTRTTTPQWPVQW